MVSFLTPRRVLLRLLLFKRSGLLEEFIVTNTEPFARYCHDSGHADDPSPCR